MSQRQKRTRVHRGTQTEEQYFQDPLPRELNGNDEYYGERGPQERLQIAEEVSWHLNYLVAMQVVQTRMVLVGNYCIF